MQGLMWIQRVSSLVGCLSVVLAETCSSTKHHLHSSAATGSNSKMVDVKYLRLLPAASHSFLINAALKFTNGVFPILSSLLCESESSCQLISRTLTFTTNLNFQDFENKYSEYRKTFGLINWTRCLTTDFYLLTCKRCWHGVRQTNHLDKGK